MQGLSSERLRFREVTPGDAAFINELLNEPAWRRYIGDHAVNSTASALRYISERLQPLYADGLGFWLAANADEPVGICGLIRRDYLEDADLGFAFLERHWRRGYGREAGQAVIDHAESALQIRRLLAITVPGNTASASLLSALGFSRRGRMLKPQSEEEVDVYERIARPG